MKHCTVIPIKDQKAMYVRCQKWCLWLSHNTAYRVLLLMSEVSNDIVLYTVASHPCQEGRLFEPSILGV